MCFLDSFLGALWLVYPATVVAAPLWYEGEDGLRHVGHEVGVVVLQHPRPLQARRLPGPDQYIFVVVNSVGKF